MGGDGVGAVKYVLTSPLTQPFVAEGLKQLHETTGNAAGGAFEVMELIASEAEREGLDNPMFAQNGHDAPSPVTARYFAVRKGLKLGGIAGVALSGMDGGIVSGADAVNSGVVWLRINALFEKMIPPSRRAKPATYTRTGWFSWEVAHKAVSAGSLELRMRQVLRQKMYSGLGSATKAGVSFYATPLAGCFVSAAASLITPKLNALFGQDTADLSQALHWYAFRESVLGQSRVGRGGKGPAMRILEVIWQQFALGRASFASLGDVIKEPRGWLVIADLLA